MTRIEKFLRGLNNFAAICRDDLTGVKTREEDLDGSFRQIQADLKRRMTAEKPKARATPSVISRRGGGKIIVPKKNDIKNGANTDLSLRPVPFPTRYYALRAQPCRAASRLYRPKALETRNNERLEQIDEYMKFPTEEKAEELDGKVDPVLHVGNFNSDQIRWRSQIKPQIL